MWETDLPNAKIFGVRLKQGDAYLMQSGGGGGFGDPYERDPALVARDVAEGYVSAAAALDLYGVVVTSEGVLNVEATRRQRSEPRPTSLASESAAAVAG